MPTDAVLDAIDPITGQTFPLLLRGLANGHYAPVSSPHIGGAVIALAPVVGATAGAVAAGATPAQDVTVKNPVGSTEVVYLGPNGVSVATGYPLAAGESVQFRAIDLAQLYAITATGTQAIAIIGTAIA